MNLPKLNIISSISPVSILFRKAREDRGYSIEYVAQHAAIEPISKLYLFELGQVELPLDRIYALANVLEISPSLILSITAGN